MFKKLIEIVDSLYWKRKVAKETRNKGESEADKNVKEYREFVKDQIKKGNRAK